MARLCKEVENPLVVSVNYLLSLNDSMLTEYYSQYNPSTYCEITNCRERLTNMLFNKIPGRMIPHCIIYNWLWWILPLFLIILGTIGNLLSIIVLGRKSMTHISSYIYLATLAVVDEIILITGLFRRWIEHATAWSFENYSDALCKLSQVIGISSSILSVWLIVTLTCERVLIIKRPFEAPRYTKASRAKYIILVLLLFSFSLSSHFFETVSLTNFSNNLQNDSFNDSNDQSNLECQFKPKYSEFTKLWFFIDGALYSWLPLILLLIINMVILVEIYNARNIHNSMINSTKECVPMTSSKVNVIDGKFKDSLRMSPVPRKVKGSTIRNRETKQLTIMLMIVSTTFLLTTSPLVILKLLIKLQGYPADNEGIAKLELTDAIFEMLMYLNHAINFYLYCATGKKFRQQLMLLFVSRRRKMLSNTVFEHGGRYNTTQCKSNILEETFKEYIYLKNTK